jgi:hypothetical protein
MMTGTKTETWDYLQGLWTHDLSVIGRLNGQDLNVSGLDRHPQFGTSFTPVLLCDLAALVQSQASRGCTLNDASDRALIRVNEAAKEWGVLHGGAECAGLHQFVTGPIQQISFESRVGCLKDQMYRTGYRQWESHEKIQFA